MRRFSVRTFLLRIVQISALYRIIANTRILISSIFLLTWKIDDFIWSHYYRLCQCAILGFLMHLQNDCLLKSELVVYTISSRSCIQFCSFCYSYRLSSSCLLSYFYVFFFFFVSIRGPKF